jgi:hypothetical protein
LDIRTPAAEQSLFRTGIDDVIILPLVLVALLARTLYRAARLIVLVAFDFVLALFLRVLTSRCSLPLRQVTAWRG